MGSFLSEAITLIKAEQRLKRGEMEPAEFAELSEDMRRGPEAFRFFRAFVLAVLHIPLTDIPYLLGLGVFVPVLAAVLLTGPNSLQLVFLFYVGLRVLVGLQDAAIMWWAEGHGHIPFTTSLFGTVLGTLPYPYSVVIGPLLWTAIEIGLYLLVYALPRLLTGVEAVFPGLVPALSTIGILQIAWHTLVRGGTNFIVAWEIPRLSDPDTFHRVRASSWRLKNRVLGRSHEEIEEAEEQWYKLRQNLESPVWGHLDGALDHLEEDSRERVKRYLLVSRKDEMILRTLLGPEDVTAL